MKKFILSIACASTIIGAVEKSPEKVRLENEVKVHLANELQSLENNRERVSKINSCLIGFITGLATGSACAFIDYWTNDNVWIPNWIGMALLRPLLISSQFKSFKSPHLSLKEKGKLKKRKGIASITGLITAWIIYTIIRNKMMPKIKLYKIY